MDLEFPHIQNELQLASAEQVQIASVEKGFRKQQMLLAGARGFRGELNRWREATERTRAALLVTGGGANVQQVAEMDAELRRLAIVDQWAVSIIERYSSREASAALATAQGTKRAESDISRLLEAEQKRRFRNLRVQGPLVDRFSFDIPHCGGRHANAVLHIVEYLNRTAGDPASKLGAVWRFMDADNTIWLYHHDELEKYKCIFFRIEVERFDDSVHVNVEGYVPFGSFDDPGKYKMAESQAMTRPGWLSTEVTSSTFNATNTINLNLTRMKSYGSTIGRSVTDGTSKSINHSTSVGSNESIADGSSLTESTNWADNWSYSSGPQGGTNSSGGSRGGGTSHARSNTYTKGTSTQDTTGTTEASNQAITSQSSTNLAESLSECRGVSRAEGQSLQVSLWNYGIDLGEDPKVHLEQWKKCHADAGRVYDRIERILRSMQESLKDKLQTLASGSSEDRELVERLAELRQKVLMEHELSAGTSTRIPSGTLNWATQTPASKSTRG